MKKSALLFTAILLVAMFGESVVDWILKSQIMTGLIFAVAIVLVALFAAGYLKSAGKEEPKKQ